MPRIVLDLSGLEAARQELQAQAAKQRAVDLDIASAQSSLDSALRAGESADAVAALRKRLGDAQAGRTDLLAQQRATRQRIDQLADGLLQRDPAAMVQALDARHPIALLPMRLETRYVPPGQPTSLRIRVYPDDLNTIEHVPALTDQEQQGGVEYWTARFAHQDDDAARIARDLATVPGRGRSAWILKVLTPENPVPGPDDDATAPQFPQVETIDSRAKATRAVLLPDRWCAIGYASGRREVFRVWGNRIPDELLLSPDWLATDSPEALLGGDRAWMVDFDAAVANGMALEVTQATLNATAA